MESVSVEAGDEGGAGGRVGSGCTIASLPLAWRPPYDWAALHAFLAARTVPGMETTGPGFYARSVVLDDGGTRGTVTVRPAPEGGGLAGRLGAAFGRPLGQEERQEERPPGLSHTFPEPARLAEADVARVLNMPRARGAAIRALAAAVIAEPDLLAPDQAPEAAVTRLTALPGIGPWTAQYIAMRALRAPDALPVGDLGLLRALDDGAGRPTAKALLARAEAWRPWRAYAAMHLWAHDADRQLARQAAGSAA